jgi:hypothetical protein
MIRELAKNSKLFLTPMKNKNVSEKSFGQQLSGYKVGEPTQDNPSGQPLTEQIIKVNGGLLLKD